MKINLSISGLLMLILVSISCADDELTGEQYNSTVIVNGDVKSTSFIMPFLWYSFSEHSEEATIRLTGVDNKGGVHNFPSVITTIGVDSCEVKMDMHAEAAIPNGKYIMQLMVGDWCAKECFFTEFVNDHLCMVSVTSDPYSSLYDTTAGAYLIKSESDFKKFLQGLATDDTDGKGNVFRQTTNLDWNEMKSSLSYGLEKREKFAGIYDGGGYAINNLSFSGASADDNVDVGLFRTLGNGAEIKNLKLQSSTGFNGIKDRGGMLAGSASGTITIKNVQIVGSIGSNGPDGGVTTGGLIGYVKDANLTIEGVQLNLTITNMNKHIGGLIGWLENSTLKINNVYTPNFEINIYADAYIGGFVGVVKNSSFDISVSALNHAGTDQMPNMFLVSSAKGKAGGVIGSIESLSAPSTISGVDIRVPVGNSKSNSSVTDVGGLVGYAYLAKPLTIHNCLVGAKVEGNNNVGGFIGRCILQCDNAVSFTGLNVISPQQKSNVEVVGCSNVGGIVGVIEGNKKSVALSGQTKLITNVTGSGDCVGGIIGKYTYGSIKLNNKAVMITDSMSVVSNTGQYTGGFIGYATDLIVDAQNNFNFGSSIPKFESFTPNVFCTVKGNTYTGGAFGYVSYCAIDGLCVRATVTGSGQYTGGIIGYTYFHHDVEIVDCTFNGIVDGKQNNTGGISGYCRNNGRFQDCINYGQVTGTDNVGGIVGKVEYQDAAPPYVYYCANVGCVTGTGDVGGIVGFMDGQADCNSWTKIKRCGNYGDISSSGGGSNGAGGILGRCKQRHVQILSCANHGNISGSAQQIGGIAGWVGKDPSSAVVWYQKSNLRVYYCANFGNVSSTHSDAYLGGISGWHEEGYEGSYEHSHLKACYNCGEILSDPSSDTGGILGFADHYAATEDCINFGKVHHGNVAVGTRKDGAIIDVVDIYYLDGTGNTWRVDTDNKFTTNDMSDKGKFGKLNWTDHWVIGTSAYSAKVGGKQHPILQDCPFQNKTWN